MVNVAYCNGNVTLRSLIFYLLFPGNKFLKLPETLRLRFLEQKYSVIVNNLSGLLIDSLIDLSNA